MHFEGKAFYNVLRLQQAENPGSVKESWKVLDYRALDTQDVFRRLELEGVVLTPKSYKSYAQLCSSPEEVAQIVIGEDPNEEKREKVYLLLFELWRRLCKEEQSLSIFCDELDYQIEQYDQGNGNEELLQELLAEFENILDKTVDEGEEPQHVFKLATTFMGHNIEGFIYTFASKQIDQSNDVYASELVDGFYEYFEEKMWLDFLRCRLVAMADSEEATFMFQHLLERLQEAPDLDLLFEILYYLIYQEDIPLFYSVFELVETLLEKEEDFQDLLEIVMEYFSTLDKEEEEKKIQTILNKRIHFKKERQFVVDDIDLQELKKVVIGSAL